MGHLSLRALAEVVLRRLWEVAVCCSAHAILRTKQTRSSPDGTGAKLSTIAVHGNPTYGLGGPQCPSVAGPRSSFVACKSRSEFFVPRASAHLPAVIAVASAGCRLSYLVSAVTATLV